MKLTPKNQMLHLFFQDLQPGPFPLRVSAETTNHCNLRCTTARARSRRRGFGYMTPELFEHLAQQSHDRRASFAPQGFGEPFLDPRFLPRLHQQGRSGGLELCRTCPDQLP
ncbi:MAG: hypothetical protein KAI24_14530 [Planctomycetes bacterium]|nr:hypothetical protein [Planctomycetota bacterium]